MKTGTSNTEALTARELLAAPPLDNTRSCDATLTCECITCHLERERLVRRGVRPHQPIPRITRKAA